MGPSHARWGFVARPVGALLPSGALFAQWGFFDRPVGPCVPVGALCCACRLSVDAWLGCVIGCVTEVGHVRPRTGHATGWLACCYTPRRFLSCPGRRAQSWCDEEGQLGGAASAEAWTKNPWSYDNPLSTESFVNAFFLF